MFIIIVNASAHPPRLAGLPNVGTCNYGYTGIYARYIDAVVCLYIHNKTLEVQLGTRK